MLVNISYSIDLDEVPRVVREFLQGDLQEDLSTKVAHRLEDSVGYLEEGKENIGKAVKSIDEIRSLLMKIDLRLADCTNILRGYEKEALNLKEPEENPETELSEIQDNLSKIREAFSHGSTEDESG
jgi:DNA repair ATPase RecN